jgi:hypothetical protein
MKKGILLCLLACIVSLLFTGCATIVTHKADLDSGPDGVRVYPPRLYLFVSNNNITPAYFPDYKQAYDIKPLTILAKQEFTVEMEDGKVKRVIANQDNTALQSVLAKAIEKAPAMMTKGAEPQTLPAIQGQFGLSPGIYRLDDDGVIRPVEKIEKR